MNTPRAAEWDAFRDRMGLKPLHHSQLTDDELEAVRADEAAAPSLGRYGRRLLGEIESYLEFFVIARAA
ncbi:MAG TPA: hypothetical protein VLV46_09790 [Gaiellaceae bacterium]|nr:hypothetical protein [Gaiellaceae bacterium]